MIVYNTISFILRRMKMGALCAVVDCYKSVSKRGYCNAHYLRLRRNGTTERQRSVGRSICSIDGCNAISAAKSYCIKHYSRWRLTGDPEKVLTTITGEPHHYYNDVVLSYDGDDCLEWPYGLIGSGYPGLWSGKRSIGVHVLVCEHFHGERPEGYQTAHSCGNKRCCNHKHIRWATPMENNADKKLHGTSQRGEINGNSKLTETKVLEIKELLKKSLPQREIAQLFSVSQKSIWMILHGKSWSHVTT